MITFGASLTGIVLVFFLYLLVRFQYVKRPIMFMIGMAALLAAIFFEGFFAAFTYDGKWAGILICIVGTIGNVVAIAAAFAACYGAKLPVMDKTQPPQA